jgi:flagellar hook-associated protein 2
MGTTTSSISTGSSQYSADFAGYVSRAVQIASLPMNQLNTQKAALSDQSTAVTSLGSLFTSLQSAVTSIQSAFGGASLQAAVSDPTKLTATLSDGAVEGSYSVSIINAGIYASSLTASNWDATGTHTFELSVNGVKHSLSPASSSAADVAAAINSAYGDQVRAAVVNVGGSDSPDYRISLQGVKLGDLDPQIVKDGASLADPLAEVQGARAEYIVNNSGVHATSDSRSISIASGITVNLTAGASGTATVAITRSSTNLGNALSGFAAAYNAIVDGLAKQTGQSGGALTGNSLVHQLSDVLRSLGTYGGQTGPIDGLKTLGLDLGKDGHLTYNATTFQQVASKDSSALLSFLGTTSTSGFLKLANDKLNSVDAADTGLIATTQTSLKGQMTTLDNLISVQQDRVDRLQQQLTDQMNAADALVSSMEQQYNYLSGMFQAMQTAAQQYK